jgi:hypothetical protein
LRLISLSLVELFDHDLLSAEIDRLARRARACQRVHFSLLQGIKKPRTFSGGASVPAGLCGFRGAFGGRHHDADLCGRLAAASTGFGPKFRINEVEQDAVVTP